LPDSLSDRQWIDLRGQIKHDCREHFEANTAEMIKPAVNMGLEQRDRPRSFVLLQGLRRWGAVSVALLALAFGIFLFARFPHTVSPFPQPGTQSSVTDENHRHYTKSSTQRETPTRAENPARRKRLNARDTESSSQPASSPIAFPFTVVLIIIVAIAGVFVSVRVLAAVRRGLQQRQADRIAAKAESYFQGLRN
jgi:hypothetical protein